jgi:hypothetical protein
MSFSRTRINGIQDILRQLFAERDMETRFKRYRVWQLWEAAVGAQIAARARPVRLRQEVLEVRVDHPVWMQQLQLLKPRILARLNQQLGEPLIRDLFLRHGRVTQATPEKAPPRPRSWPRPPLDPGERQRIEQAMAGLNDPELRRHLSRLMGLQARLDKARHKSSDKEED